jgi:hypothetical protein
MCIVQKAEPLVEEVTIVTELVKKFLAHNVYEPTTGPFSETVESNLHRPTLFILRSVLAHFPYFERKK